jgi:hypothetical protein
MIEPPVFVVLKLKSIISSPTSTAGVPVPVKPEVKIKPALKIDFPKISETKIRRRNICNPGPAWIPGPKPKIKVKAFGRCMKVNHEHLKIMEGLGINVICKKVNIFTEMIKFLEKITFFSKILKENLIFDFFWYLLNFSKAKLIDP